MKQKRISFIFLSAGILLITGCVFFLTATPVQAQCGSQASSCKNCHETQAQLLVNNDGTEWHTKHAFGDFCYICHGGNPQATDKDAAHTGMVDPLADINTSCKSCHPTDALAKAQIMADILGVQVGVGGTPAATSQFANATPAATEAAQAAAPTVEVAAADMVDYSQRYDEIVLGKLPINWGNVILIVMILVLAVGGGGFVVYNERLVKVTFGDTKKVEGEYASEIVDMLPAIAGLKPQARKTLKSILDNPKKTDKVLGLIDEVISEKKSEE